MCLLPSHLHKSLTVAVLYLPPFPLSFFPPLILAQCVTPVAWWFVYVLLYIPPTGCLAMRVVLPEKQSRLLKAAPLSGYLWATSC